MAYRDLVQYRRADTGRRGMTAEQVEQGRTVRVDSTRLLDGIRHITYLLQKGLCGGEPG